MEIVQNQGQLNLVPIEGDEPESCAGFYIRSTDAEGSNITFVIPVPYQAAVKFAEAIIGYAEEHEEGTVGGPKVEVFGEGFLDKLKDRF